MYSTWSGDLQTPTSSLCHLSVSLQRKERDMLTWYHCITPTKKGCVYSMHHMSQVFPLSSHSLSAVFSLVSTSFKWFWRFLRTYVYTCTCDQSKQFYVYLTQVQFQSTMYLAFLLWVAVFSEPLVVQLFGLLLQHQLWIPHTEEPCEEYSVRQETYCTRIFTSSKAHKELVEYHEFNPRTAIPDSQKC